MAGTDKIRVLIVDDIYEGRDNVAKLLRFEADIEVVGLADGGEDGIEQTFRLEPDIVLMDINMPGIDGITATQRIMAKLPNTAVIMMSVNSESDYLRRSMLAGAREFLAKPFSLEELIESIRHVYQLAQQNRRVTVPQAGDPMSLSSTKGKLAKIITVFGLKGGVGRSTVAINTAVALRGLADREVALLDANLLYGDIGVMLNLTDNRTIADAAKHFETIDRDLVNDIMLHHSSGVRAILAPPNPQVGESITLDHIRGVLQHALTMTDYLVVDTRPSFDDITLALLDQSDHVLLVTSLDLPAIKAAKQYLEVADLLGYDQEKVILAVNRASPHAGVTTADVEATLRLPVAVTIPDEPLIALRAINEGVPFVQSQPHAAISQDVLRLAARLGGQLIAEPEAEMETVSAASTPAPSKPNRWGLSRLRASHS